MKAISDQFCRVIITLALGALTSPAIAGPGPQYWKSPGLESQFKQPNTVEPGFYVCAQCKSLSDVKLPSQKHATQPCKVGSLVICPSCQLKAKVVRKLQRNDPASHTKLVHVNTDGVECKLCVKPVGK